MLTLSFTPLSTTGWSKLKTSWYWGGISGLSRKAPPVAVDDEEENALRKIGSSNFTTHGSSPSNLD